MTELWPGQYVRLGSRVGVVQRVAEASALVWWADSSRMTEHEVGELEAVEWVPGFGIRGVETGERV